MDKFVTKIFPVVCFTSLRRVVSQMMNQFDKDKEPLVVINNVKTLSTKSVERYCRMYDKDLCCFRRKTLSYHPYIHVLFSSMITAKNFLNDRPHYIEKCRVK